MSRYVVLIAAFLMWTSAPVSAQPDPAAHQQLNSILQRPMYQAWRLRQEGHVPEVDVTFSAALKQWVRSIGQAIGKFFDALFASGGTSSSRRSLSAALPTILRIIAWVALAIAMLFSLVLLGRLLGKQRVQAPLANILSRSMVSRAMESGDALAMGTAQWMEEARRLADEQNFRAVYRALYLALLSGLNTLNKIDYSRNRTNWVYVQRYRGPSDERATFADLTQLFDRVWYGRKEAENNDLEGLQNQVASLTRVGGGRA